MTTPLTPEILDFTLLEMAATCFESDDCETKRAQYQRWLDYTLSNLRPLLSTARRAQELTKDWQDEVQKRLTAEEQLHGADMHTHVLKVANDDLQTQLAAAQAEVEKLKSQIAGNSAVAKQMDVTILNLESRLNQMESNES